MFDQATLDAKVKSFETAAAGYTIAVGAAAQAQAASTQAQAAVTQANADILTSQGTFRDSYKALTDFLTTQNPDAPVTGGTGQAAGDPGNAAAGTTAGTAA